MRGVCWQAAVTASQLPGRCWPSLLVAWSVAFCSRSPFLTRAYQGGGEAVREGGSAGGRERDGWDGVSKSVLMQRTEQLYLVLEPAVVGERSDAMEAKV